MGEPKHSEIAMSWHDRAEMQAQPKAWYWSEFPGCWIWYCPEKNMIRGLDHGDTLWHEPLSKRYYGPWFQPNPDGNHPGLDKAIRISGFNPIHAVALKGTDDGDEWSIVPGTAGSSQETAESTAIQLSLAGDEETQFTAVEIKADGIYPVGETHWGVHEL